MNASSESGPAERGWRFVPAALVAAALVFAAGVTEGQRPMPTTTTTGTTGASEFEPFLGTYRAIDLDHQKTVIDEAIMKGTAEMGPLRRKVGRKRLHAVNEPVREVRIVQEGDRIVTVFDGDRYVAPASGAAQRERDPEGKRVDVSYRVLGRTMRARYVGPDGEKVMAFELRGDDRLTMDVTLLSPQLPEPIRYQLAFRRE